MKTKTLIEIEVETASKKHYDLISMLCDNGYNFSSTPNIGTGKEKILKALRENIEVDRGEKFSQKSWEQFLKAMNLTDTKMDDWKENFKDWYINTSGQNYMPYSMLVNWIEENIVSKYTR